MLFMKLRNALLAASVAVAAVAAASAPAIASPARAQTRWQLTPVGRGQPDCLTSKHAIGRNRGFVFSSRRRYTVTFLIDVTRLPPVKVDVYVSSVSGDGYGGNSDYGGFGGCPTKRIKLATVRVHHHLIMVAASTSWLPVDAAVYVSVKPAGSTVTWNYATSSVFFP
jgi:hypothetical protein